MAKEEGYNYGIVKGFALSSLIWGFVSILIGIIVSVQMVSFKFNFEIPWLTFGRLRVVHTNGTIFGFVLGAIFSLFYYMTQRLTKSPLFSAILGKIHLYLFNFIIAISAITLMLGHSQSKEYAELEWPVDILITGMWVIFSINILATIFKRKEEQMYVSLWYIIATLFSVGLLYIVNNLVIIPVSFLKSYSFFAGVDDANVQWWYGHNAVAFVLTTPILAMFYYVLPKTINAPIFSHRLSLISFWSLVFMYLWTGAHHLLYTPVPDWIQTVATIFSILLIIPSWGAVLNGYYTMNGYWDKMKSNYIVKFVILGITFYALQTLQGPFQSIRTISAFVHFTDWVPGHVHMGTMGWVALTIAASYYYIFPKIYKIEIYSEKLANIHFWLALTGQLIFSITMWIAGVRQGIMWHSLNSDGSLTYTFNETMNAMYPYWKLRAAGGIIFFAGFCIFVYNLLKTVQKSKTA